MKNEIIIYQFIDLICSVSVQSKRGAAITTLHLASDLSQEELQQDMGVLAQQALPLEFRAWNGLELPLMPRVETQFVDVVFLVGGYQAESRPPVHWDQINVTDTRSLMISNAQYWGNIFES